MSQVWMANVQCNLCKVPGSWSRVQPYSSQVIIVEAKVHSDHFIIAHFRGSPIQMPATVFNKPYPVYEVITILRCLYLKQSFDAKWKKLRELEPHEEARKKNGKWVFFISTYRECKTINNLVAFKIKLKIVHPPTNQPPSPQLLFTFTKVKLFLTNLKFQKRKLFAFQVWQRCSHNG